VIPASAEEKIISRAATSAETAVLLAIAAAPDVETETDAEYYQLLSDATGLDIDEVSAAIAFWRGASVISIAGKSKHSSPIRITPTLKRETEAEERKTVEDTVNLRKNEPNVSVPTVQETAVEPQKPEPPARKAILREELPKYDSATISEICGRDGGMLAAVIDQCQQIFERMFNPNDVSVIVSLNDYLGLEPEYILILCAYYAKKKPGCRLSYIEKTAYTLWNDGITTVADLESHIKSMETYDGVVGGLRKLMGIGSRTFTKKENGLLNHWINDFGYGSDVIEFCYEITVNSIGDFKFDYADKVLEGWYAAGVRTLDDAVKASESFKAENAKRFAASSGGITESSFDGDDFLALAIKRSADGK
jgi:DnaD/phage-associated family protein